MASKHTSRPFDINAALEELKRLNHAKTTQSTEEG